MAKQAHLRDVAAALTGTAPLLQWNPAAMARSATALEPMAADVHGSICASQSFVVRPMAATVSPVVMADMAVEPHRVTAARTAATVAEVAWAAEAVGITAAEAVVDIPEAVVAIASNDEVPSHRRSFAGSWREPSRRAGPNERRPPGAVPAHGGARLGWKTAGARPPGPGERSPAPRREPTSAPPSLGSANA